MLALIFANAFEVAANLQKLAKAHNEFPLYGRISAKSAREPDIASCPKYIQQL